VKFIQLEKPFPLSPPFKLLADLIKFKAALTPSNLQRNNQRHKSNSLRNNIASNEINPTPKIPLDQFAD